MAARALLPLSLLMASLGAACSLLLPFDPEGLPCDQPTGLCQPGFVCESSVCVRSDAGEPCGGCEPGERCDEVSGACVEDSCDTRVCPVNFECLANSAGRTACVQLAAPAPGHACSSDSQCEAGRVCFKGAIPTAAGLLQTGACLEPCDAPSDVCATTGATCRPFTMGIGSGAVHLCVTDRLLTSCQDSASCAPHGLTCTVFDHPDRGPLTLCDSPLSGGAAFGAACTDSSGASDPSQRCANGLCVPRNAGAEASTCSETCTDSSCPAGTSCRLVEFSLEQGAPVRQVPMCTAAATTCTDCAASAAVCGADAPRCTFFGSGPVCLSACTPEAGPSACAPGLECQVLGAGPRCVPTAGCP